MFFVNVRYIRYIRYKTILLVHEGSYIYKKYVHVYTR